MTLRRSTRPRNHTPSYYEEEKKRLEEEELTRSTEKEKKKKAFLRTKSPMDEEEEESNSDDDGDESTVASMQGDEHNEDNDDEGEEQEEEEGHSSDSEDDGDDDDDDDDEDYETKNPKGTPGRSSRKKVTPTSSSTKLSFSSKTKKSTSKKSQSKSKSKSKKVHQITLFSKLPSKSNTSTRSIQNALQSLTKKLYNAHRIQPRDNTSAQRRFSNSLFLSLLSSYKNPKQFKSTLASASTVKYHENDLYYTQPVTRYTSNLSQIAYDLVHRHNETNNSTAMHIDLLNLLFLSIGGTPKSMLVHQDQDQDQNDGDGDEGTDLDVPVEELEESASIHSHVMDVDSDGESKSSTRKKTKRDNKNNKDNTGQIIADLEELDEEDWDKIVTVLADDMRNTPDDCTPFCCDPNGALHWSAMQSIISDAVKNDEKNHKDKGGRGKGSGRGKGKGKGKGQTTKNDDGYNSARMYKSITVSEKDVAVKRGNATVILGAKEYRSIYEEFWYVLGTVALVEGGMSSGKDRGLDEDDEGGDEDGNSDIDSDEEEEEEEDDDDILMAIDGSTTKKRKKSSSGSKSKKRAKKATTTKKSNKKKSSSAAAAASASTTRFDTEIVHDILNRITELLSVGQPDARAAATTAAIYLLHAIVDKSAFVQQRLEVTSRQFAAAVGSSKKSKKSNAAAATTAPPKLGAKAESLKHQIDSLKRTSDELEHLIESVFINSIFMHRYRDSNMYIRAECLKALGRMATVRPDLFLVDKYLKYLGWMLSDKAECVRVAALEGLHRPFQFKESQKYSKVAEKIDLMTMERVVNKFLSRIVDCVIDIHDSVQERGLKMMLSLMRNGFLDEADDGEGCEELVSEEMWDQVNLMALDSDTTPVVRRDALYFIMEQLEDFDDGNDDDDLDDIEDLDDIDESERLSSKKKRKSSGKIASAVSDRRVAQRLDAIASWAAHTLTTGKIPIEKIRIHLVDHLVHSLRAMPEHKSIVTNWSAMVRAITADNLAMTSQGTSAGDRADVAKQRVLVQMLICAAKAEVGSVDADFLSTDLDPDVVQVLEQKNANGALQPTDKKKKANKSSSNVQHESLSVALIKALPNLLVQFKSDSTIIESLVSLPRYFIPTVFSLSQRKSDFVAMTKTLTEIFLQSNDENVLANSAYSLSFLSNGEHARAVEAKTTLKKTVCELRDRILTHISVEENSKQAKTNSSKGKSPSEQATDDTDDDEDDDMERPKDSDTHYALYYNLKRIGVLAKRIDISEYIGSNEDEDYHFEEFCNFISDGLAHRLTTYKDKTTGSASGNEDCAWKAEDEKLLQITALIIYEGLQFLLSVTSWKVKSMLEENQLLLDNDELFREVEETDEESGGVDHIAIRLRDRLVVLVLLCFEQYLPEVEESNEYSPAIVEWSDSIQEVGSLIASDLRSLFMKEWSDTTSPLLRAAAITDDNHRISGGHVRYVRAKQSEIIENNDIEQEEQSQEMRCLLLTLARNLATNWKVGNRREAGHILCHITGSGTTASEIVDGLSRLLKKVEPVRLLESHMASLQITFNSWLDNDPEAMMEENFTQGTDDETMNVFQELEENRNNQFKNLLSQAQKFSSSLGVRKLSNDKMPATLLNFMKKGIDFAFSGHDDLLLGSKLTFLTVLSKYAHWIRKVKSHRIEVAQFLHRKEAELKEQETSEREKEGEEFEGIHEDDLQALYLFRSVLGLKESTIFKINSSETTSSFDTRTPESSRFGNRQDSIEDTPRESRDVVSDLSTASFPSSAKTRRSRSSAGSALSKMSSARGSLATLYEASDSEEEESPNGESTASRTSTRPKVFSPENSGVKSVVDVTEGGYESGSSFISPNAGAKTQTTYDGEQSDREGESEAILETPH